MIKQNKFIFFLILAILFSFSKELKAQIPTVPISSYGVWDRGESIDDYSDPKYDYILGIEVDDKWANLQPNANTAPDFSIYQETLNKAVLYDKQVKISVNVGTESPMWIYDNGVPLVEVTPNLPKNESLKFNPYYLNQQYKDLYFEFIRQFSIFLRNQPQDKFDKIGFLQVKTGATGDEEPYKGEPIDSAYNISKEDWQAFRLESFEIFKAYFNDVLDRRILLSFNNVDPIKQPEANNWVFTEIDSAIGFGIKGGAYNRGHHLEGEPTFKKQWLKYLVNPKGTALFSASEMDQSWRQQVFSINTELGFYWSVMGAINTGVSSTNVTKSAIEYIYEHDEIRDIYKMYNKFAQQVYPGTATAVLSVFHEGLDASDTIKYSEETYGNAARGNIDRYVAISEANKERGVKIGDTLALNKGQVYHRLFQTAYNDVGWDIESGNYERFLTQIDPDGTSIGLFRVRGTIDENSSKYDRFARSFENDSGKNTMYFKFDNEMFLDAQPASLSFKIIWLDRTAGTKWSVIYKNTQGSMTSAIDVVGVGSTNPQGEWKEVNFTLADALIDGSGLNGSDFTLMNTDSVDDIFNGIEIDIERLPTLSISNNDLDQKDFMSFFNEDTFNAHINFASNSKGTIKLFSIYGKLLMSEDVWLKENTNVFSKSLRLPPGIYIAVLNTGGIKKTQKLIKK